MSRSAIALACAIFLAAAPAAAMTFTGKMSGLQEVPANMSPASGRGTIMIAGDTMDVMIRYRDLTAPLTIAHIHCCVPAGANAGIAVDLDMVPLPTTLSGSFTRSFDLSSAMTYRASFIAASGGTVDLARARLLDAFATELAYFNLHTSTFPGGEIRGQILVPEPGAWAMLIAGFGLVGAAVRRRRQALA